MKRVLLISVLLIYMGIIFYFSHQTGVSSQSSSDILVDGYVNILNSNLDLEVVSLVIRKSAHFISFGILASVMFFTLKSFKVNILKNIIISFIFTAFYAATDEFHQTFIIGRSGEVKDVLIDSMGAIFFLLVLYLIYRRRYDKC